MTLATFAGLKTAIADWAWSEVTTTQIGTDFFPRMQSKMYYGDGDGRDGQVQIAAAHSADGRQRDADAEFNGPDRANDRVRLRVSRSDQFAAERDQLEDARLSRSVRVQEAHIARGRRCGALLHDRGRHGLSWPLFRRDDLCPMAREIHGTIGRFRCRLVLTNAPQVYMDGCLMEVCTYLQDDRYAQFRSNFAAGIDALNRNNQVAKMSGAIKRAVPRSYA